MSNSAQTRSGEFLKIASQFQLGSLVTEASHPVTANLSDAARDNIAAGLRQLFEVDNDVVRKYGEFAESGLVNLISYIGPLLGLSFALVFSILSHVGLPFYDVIVQDMIYVALVYAIAVILDNFISYPIIFSNSLKVHPLELFFVILSGAQLGGLGGMMIAAPLYTVLRILAKELLSQFEIIQNITRKI